MHASQSLSAAVAHAVSFLTRPLILSYPPSTMTKLQTVLGVNLTAFYAPLWDPREPLRNSNCRCISMGPNSSPPKVVYTAGLASGVQWRDWMHLLGGREFQLYVDPGCVYLQETNSLSHGSKLVPIWADDQYLPASTSRTSSRHAGRKTVAQLIIEDDQEEDDRLFAMLADEVNEPVWTTPVVARFPSSGRSTSPMSTLSSHSRSSSYSSDSLSSLAESNISFSSASSMGSQKLSRRERAREDRVYVDTSKTEVTRYDAACTTVLSGGTMLGGPKVSRRA